MEVMRLASGLRGVQSSGGKETRQKLGAAWGKARPTSGISLDPAFRSTTVQVISSLVIKFLTRSSCPARTDSRK